jgi:tRNA_anti-like
MPVTVFCPSCGVKLKAPDNTAGRKLACPKCRTPITVPATSPPGAVTQSPPRPAAEARTSAAPAPAAKAPADTKSCPYCSEQILATARKCKHCGEMLDEAGALAAAIAPRKGRRDEDEADNGESRAQRGPRGAGHTTVIVNTPKEFPHLVHLIMSFFTCGAWLPVYAIHGLVASRGGGTTLALILGIPLCLAILGCGGCLTMAMLGSAASRTSSSVSPQPAGGATPVAASNPAPANRPAAAAAASVAPVAAAAPRAAQVTITAPLLLDAYMRSEVTADANYTGKAVAVSGTVIGTRLDMLGAQLVELDGHDVRFAGLYRVQCRMAKAERERGAALQAGQEVTLQGVCEGKGDVIDPVGRLANIVVGDARLVRVEATREPPPPEVQWADFPSPHTFQQIVFGVRSVRVDNVTLHVQGGADNGREVKSASKYLIVKLFVENQSKGQFTYTHPLNVKLIDERGTEFRPHINPGLIPTSGSGAPPRGTLVLRGQWQSLLLMPGQRYTDLLLFEPGDELGKGQRLLLAMSGEVWRDSGQGRLLREDRPKRIGFRLNQSDIVYGPESTPSAPAPAVKPAPTPGKSGQRPTLPMR